MSEPTYDRIIPVPESLDKPLRQFRHDLRTPLNHIIGLSDLWVGEIGEDAAQVELREDLRRILAAAWKLNDMLERFIAEEGIVIPVHDARESPK